MTARRCMQASRIPTPSPSRTSPFELLQPRGDNRHAVFFTHPREAIDYHYERKLVDLAANENRRSARPARHDAGGRCLRQRRSSPSRSAMAARPGLSPLLSRPIENKQTQLLITYTENHVTNAINDQPDDLPHAAAMPKRAPTS